MERPSIERGSFWEGEGTNLDYVVFEAEIFLLLAAAVLDVEDAYEVSSPAAHKTVEELQQHSRQHPKLGKGIWQREENLSHLQSTR